jgi:hypothetical protein
MHCEGVHCPDSETVRFAIYPDGLEGARILARIRDDALHDLFGAHDDEDSLLAACSAHFDTIEAMALARHRAAPAKPVMLDLADFLARDARNEALCY